MQSVHEGQCGLCKHFGESHPSGKNLTEIRTTSKAPEALVDECGHPKLATLKLKVTPISGCNGFELAKAA